MKLLAESDSVISYFSGDLTIISGSLVKMGIYSNKGILIIDLDLKLLYAKTNSFFKLRLIDVQEYSFYHKNDHVFYNISNYKFFKKDGLFYLSLDPEDENDSRSKNDNDLILSRAIEAYSISLSE